VDTIDLYQIHWPVEDMKELEEGWSTMAQLQREGKARWIGVSNFNVEQMERAQAIAPITSLQPRYSLVHPEVEPKILPFCEDKGIGVIVYSPMASGLLTGSMTRERISKLPNDDWRKHDPDFNEPSLSANLALVEQLRAVGKRRGIPRECCRLLIFIPRSPAAGASQSRWTWCCRGSSPTQWDLTEIEGVTEPREGQ
jgi:aryl-alcohol dehydrogenase-like predicted oxidoreductase